MTPDSKKKAAVNARETTAKKIATKPVVSTKFPRKKGCQEAHNILQVTDFIDKYYFREKLEDDKEPECMRVRRLTVKHPFGMLKAWMGHTHFQMKVLKHVSREMSLHVLAYNLKRVMNSPGAKPLIQSIQV